MQKNIILIGFMGTGKSTIGRNLSQTFGYPLIDTDNLIVEQDGRSIPQIFKEEGEQAFRDMETKLLQSLNRHTGHIIATGGGIIGRPENRQLLRKLGYVVWLIARPAEILERTSRNSNRPLLNNEDPEKTIRDLLEIRTPLYRDTAHLGIETDNLSFDEVTTGIIESARYYFGTQE
ncbi:MAG: shikimate kinase [Akkermansiaceae bacterium]|jgi:shikimate kinase|nr:shikimate kinase [Akkermansiaceae bacterium]